MFMKKRNIYLFAGMLCLLSGCASSPSPQLVNGAYFLAGDAECARYRQTHSQQEDGAISCYDSQGHFTGTRYAMTSQDMQLYLAQQESGWKAFSDAMAQMNQNRPVYTNCYRFGNQVQCTSY
jgi:hypothetical protein